ncbi:protein-methionine-sulfoxide reductase catalytic subunit MsrP [Pararhizobium sp.]|uniref:protein-methionine-sulfoxide reductase catalytic subunit MsrP n=1 Tax=Pararhizobium sp. TaxID=1977563 RepID=UPI00271A34CD|nr:protein-methionine-sulfoxide reductase catalytic subunit MsrP [Pararhizobium sp.]MDO9414763.1 protein-methionine-sulfoxide reductase catalytic subunit MsrP [Pararhizobium sp.]
MFPRRPAWSIPESEATPEEVFLNRRALIKAAGFAGLGLAGLSTRALADAVADPSASLYPARRNGAYDVGTETTPEEFNLTYNNFFEFGSHKKIGEAAQALAVRPWEIAIDGMVEVPFKIGLDDLLAKVSLEERIYRHRCVEAWSMVVPWSGFALSDLVALAKPLASARYLRFETFLNPDVATGQQQSWYPWPYAEGMTIEEAANPLAFVVTGAYGKPVARQMGAPIRLALPWKYGFKSIKSIRRISFADKRPVSFWESVAPAEYGFWANVNPGVPHPRWRQDSEKILHTGTYRRTDMFNGYGQQVAHLYADMKGEKLYY